MLELANTSLPNGLIPGTHGFATVAMTKGVPDALRIRLEAFCAYTHKSSAHDATYQSQNPVNWFHAILPQGEHVIGRVTASDFDYTGRTNRLARLLVLKPSEMPRCGAAAILAAERKRLSEPWSGEPRHLPEDVESARRITTLAVPLNSAPANWTALFGADGAVLAKRVAMQLKKNISDGRRPIYFKTSAAFDQDGTRLLGLFSDVIGLLPQELRASVTFSTYPDALPGGTGCLLRGAFEGDKSFAAASATQSWIDCEAGRVVHAELLPEAKAQPTSEVQARGARPGVNAIPAWSANAQMTTRANAPKPSSHAAKAHGGKSSSLVYSANGGASDRKFYAILVTCAAVVVAAFAMVAIIMLNNQRKEWGEDPQRHAEEQQREDEKPWQIPKEQQELTNREKEKKRRDEEAKLDTERTEEAQQKKATERQTENEKPKEMLAHETKPVKDKAPPPPKDIRPEFCNATNINIKEIRVFSDSRFVSSHTNLTAFFYAEDKCHSLTNETVVAKQTMDSWTYDPKIENLAKRNKGHFLILYDAGEQIAYWLWKEWPKKPEHGKQWFATDNVNDHDLWHDVFGHDNIVGVFFKLHKGTPTFTIIREETGVEIGVTKRETSIRSAQLALFKPMSYEWDDKVDNSIKYAQTNRVLKAAIEDLKTQISKREKEINEEANNNSANDSKKKMEDDPSLKKLKEEKDALEKSINEVEDLFSKWWKPEAKKAKYAIVGVEGKKQ